MLPHTAAQSVHCTEAPGMARAPRASCVCILAGVSSSSRTGHLLLCTEMLTTSQAPAGLCLPEGRVSPARQTFSVLTQPPAPAIALQHISLKAKEGRQCTVRADGSGQRDSGGWFLPRASHSGNQMTAGCRLTSWLLCPHAWPLGPSGTGAGWASLHSASPGACLGLPLAWQSHCGPTPHMEILGPKTD